MGDTIRERAVREIDARHGYTMEFSSSPEAHAAEYDERERELRDPSSPYADLRARLAPLAAAATEGPLELARYDHGGGRLAKFDGARILVADFFNEGDREFIVALVNAYSEIDALLARGEAAEADADRLTIELKLLVDWHPTLGSYPMTKSAIADALRLHDDALALRERPS